MTQDLQLPGPTDSVTTARVKHNNSLQTLRDSWAGGSAPSSPQDGQTWYDSTNHVLYVRRNGAWKPLPLQAIQVHAQYLFPSAPAAYSTAQTVPIAMASVDMLVAAARITTQTATSSTPGNYWELSIVNMTQSLDLNATRHNTSVNGDLAPASAWDVGVDQNLSITANDVLGLRIRSVGSPTSLASKLVSAHLLWGPE